ncbi:MAG: TrkH family potassium uptake protein [Planctomycetota bacterium]|jgi:trk system potassium uptake protein TrkH
MRKRSERLNCILHYTGHLLEVLGVVLLLPALVAVVHWQERDEGWMTVNAFVFPAAFSLVVGFTLRNVYRSETLDTISSMLMCAIGWLACSAIGAVPFVIGIKSGYLDAYFEAMSGFTTTGITVYTGLDAMPYSILFWRALTQWFGGLGILSFFLIVTFRASSAHHIFGAESHKISSTRPAPGLFNTLKILWLIYGGFTLLATGVLIFLKMPAFDAVCHAFTALSTGGFSPHDASIAFYEQSGHANYRLIEYALTFIMMLGGINFLIHYRVLTGDIRALWDNIEIRYWWRLIVALTAIVMIDRFHTTGALRTLFASGTPISAAEAERTFRGGLFQVMSVLTTTGFGTKDIGSEFFGAASKQLFLVMMVIGGCVGSTAGGFKVLRVAMLNRLIWGELFKAKVSSRASTDLVIDKKIVPEAEIHRIAALFFGWIALLVVGGVVTALFSEHEPLKCVSGMFSALGNIGPCYLSVQEMIDLHPVVKITYIVGMLAGRLELLPVLMLFSPRAWR